MEVHSHMWPEVLYLLRREAPRFTVHGSYGSSYLTITCYYSLVGQPLPYCVTSIAQVQ